MSLRLRTDNPLAWLLSITFATALSGVAQEPGNLDKRDLQIQKMPVAPPLNHVPSIPRGYAVVIGVAKYEKLAPEEDLGFQRQMLTRSVRC